MASTSTPPILCLACSSSLSPCSPSATPSLPAHSEKLDPPPHLHSCGLHWVCGRCIRVNRRLAQHCLLCESVEDVLGGRKEGRKEGRTEGRTEGQKVALPGYQEVLAVEADEEEFVIGDDEDEEKVEQLDRANADTPPAYEAPPLGDRLPDDKQSSIHYILPTETLLGLSLKYRIDGPSLCTLNHLPLSTLSTTPHLLHTLPFLLLPLTLPSLSSSPLLSPSLERRRLILRRFQVRTRCAEWAMANAYVSAVFEGREKEKEMIRKNRVARGDEREVYVREGGELEEAVESWKRDAEWEKGQKGKGMGSKIRSTGEVEQAVKGWSWR